MKKRLNSTFFGICFLAALLGEAYCFLVLGGEIISTIGIGVVVLITGYLFLESVISSLKKHLEDTRSYTDRILQEETSHLNEKYMELINFQKAIYTATKKNTALMAEQMRELAERIEVSGNGSVKELQRIIDLQKKTMEGQKNALNMEIHYNRENTKNLINTLKESDNRPDYVQQVADIIKLLEENKQLLSSGIVTLDVYKQAQNLGFGAQEPVPLDQSIPDILTGEPSEDALQVDVREAVTEDALQDIAQEEEVQNVEQNEFIEDIDDNDFAAALGTNIGYIEDDYPVTPDNPSGEVSQQPAAKEPKAVDPSFLSQDMLDQVMKENPNQFVDESEYDMKDGVSEEEGNSSPDFPDKEENGFDTFVAEEKEKTITPLYSDPNKALTADEIAALFASFGQ